MLAMMLTSIVQIVSINEEPNNMNLLAIFLIGFSSFFALANIVRFKLAHWAKERTTRPIHAPVITDAHGIAAFLKLHLSLVCVCLLEIISNWKRVYKYLFLS